jgi:hypothetical protein
VATEKAQAAITNVEGMIKALDRIQTESRIRSAPTPMRPAPRS